MTQDASPATPSPSVRPSLAGPFIGAIRLYQLICRPYMGDVCKYKPSCSDYALESLQRHGVFRGGLLAAWRILRCNPFARGGFDPVPTTWGERRCHHEHEEGECS